MTTACTTEQAANLRKAYKALGWSSRKISVTSEYFSMGSAIRVTIKDLAVDFPKIKAMALACQEISRDESGEILGGGNCYVTVDWSAEIDDTLSARYATACEAAIAELESASQDVLVPIAGTTVMIGGDGPGFYRLWRDRAGMSVCDARSASKYVALYTMGWL